MAEDTRRRIYMPSLKELEIVPQSFEAIFWSLHRLAPSPRRKCILDFRHGIPQATISSLQIQHCLGQNVQSLFSSGNSGSIIFGMHTILLMGDVNNVSDPSSSPHLHVKLQSASSLIMETVVESINQCDLSSLTHVRFDFYPEPNASCIKLILTQTLFNATHVTITPMTLKSIMKLYDRNFPAGVMFPSLQVLTFDTLEAAFDIDTSTLQQFLDSRPDMPRIQVRKVGNARLPSGELVAFNLERVDEDHLVWA
ncbi:hypothetical protein CPC08DRAFT_709370 [Agrocybe pediades]|nr:hypothetical protein CPC08DRAFT_709370 [Agrocybe pediades]